VIVSVLCRGARRSLSDVVLAAFAASAVGRVPAVIVTVVVCGRVLAVAFGPVSPAVFGGWLDIGATAAASEARRHGRTRRALNDQVRQPNR